MKLLCYSVIVNTLLLICYTSPIIPEFEYDLLLPYEPLDTGAKTKRSAGIACPEVQNYSTNPSTLYASNTSHESELIYFHDLNSTGHIFFFGNPLNRLGLIEPLGAKGCKEKRRAKVSTTSVLENCEVAINAGYFNSTSGECFGNVVIDSEVIQHSNGIQNVHFGLTSNGSIFVGYVTKQDVISNSFKLLVGGVLWILKDGEPFVNESIKMECKKTENTGTLEFFADVKSARTAVGHDKFGHIVFAHVDGSTRKRGVNLHDFANLLKSHGVINAINLDGGGSSTFVINSTVVNYPSDCRSSLNKRVCYERRISTVLCAKKHNQKNEPEKRESDIIKQEIQNSVRCSDIKKQSIQETNVNKSASTEEVRKQL